MPGIARARRVTLATHCLGSPLLNWIGQDQTCKQNKQQQTNMAILSHITRSLPITDMMVLELPPRAPRGLFHFQVWESKPKPSFVTGILGGGRPKWDIDAASWKFCTTWNKKKHVLRLCKLPIWTGSLYFTAINTTSSASCLTAEALAFLLSCFWWPKCPASVGEQNRRNSKTKPWGLKKKRLQPESWDWQPA